MIPRFDGRVQLRKDDLNGLVRQATQDRRRKGGMGQGGLDLNGSGYNQFSSRGRLYQGVWGKILEVRDVGILAMHSWKEQRITPDGTWADHLTPLFGDFETLPAVEKRSRRMEVGSIQFMRLGGPRIDSSPLMVFEDTTDSIFVQTVTDHADGSYGWVEVKPAYNGVFAAFPGGRTGSPIKNPLYEKDLRKGIKGVFRAYPGYSTGPNQQPWVFDSAGFTWLVHHSVSLPFTLNLITGTFAITSPTGLFPYTSPLHPGFSASTTSLAIANPAAADAALTVSFGGVIGSPGTVAADGVTFSLFLQSVLHGTSLVPFAVDATVLNEVGISGTRAMTGFGPFTWTGSASWSGSPTLPGSLSVRGRVTLDYRYAESYYYRKPVPY